MGLRRSVVGLATIFGPLWAGAAIPWPYVMFSVMTGLLVMSLVRIHLSHVMRKLDSCSNCTADQRLCFRYSHTTISLLPKYSNFKFLAISCDCTGRSMSDLVGNPEDKFSHIAAHVVCNIWMETFVI